MSTSLSLRHSETSSWDRPFQTRSHKWYFLHQHERGLTAPPLPLCQAAGTRSGQRWQRG